MIRTVRGQNFAWYDVEKPTKKDIEKLKKELRIHPLVLDELIPQVRHPKLEQFPSHIFLVLTIPILERDKEGYYSVRLEELDFVFGESWLVTSRYRSIEAVESLFSSLTDGGEHKGMAYIEMNPASLLYSILSRILRQSIRSLDIIEERLEEVERAVFDIVERKSGRQMVRELSELRRDIIDFSRALSPTRPVFRILDDVGPALLDTGSLPYFRNLTGQMEQIVTLLKTLKETVEALEETNQSLLTTRINNIMRILTIYSVLVLPPTLLASVFGMNFDFPFPLNAVFFWKLLFGMAALIVLPLFYFRRKGWI